jgi:hypothetical protein
LTTREGTEYASFAQGMQGTSKALLRHREMHEYAWGEMLYLV